MATFGPQWNYSAQAGADLSAVQYHVLEIDSNGFVSVASNDAGAAASIVGVLENKPDSGEMATVGYLGESKVKCGGSVTIHNWVTCGGSGLAATATSGDMIFGFAQETGAAEQIIRVLLFPPQRLGGAV